jgi:hypothetical protein
VLHLKPTRSRSTSARTQVYDCAQITGQALRQLKNDMMQGMQKAQDNLVCQMVYQTQRNFQQMQDLLASDRIANFQAGTANLQASLMKQISSDNCNTFRECSIYYISVCSRRARGVGWGAFGRDRR